MSYQPKGFEAGGKFSSNPIGSEGKSISQRKASRDPGLTPTEKTQKARLMRQFMRTGEGGGSGVSKAYRESAAWCSASLCRRLATKDGKCDGHQP